MAWYTSGTISLTNGSTTVTGSGTSWVAGAGIGEALYAPDGRIYEIADIASNTSLTLASAYLGTTQSGQAYKIIPTQSYIRDLAADAASLISQYAGIASGAGAGKFTDGALATPGIAFASDVDTGLFRSATNTLQIVAGGAAALTATTSGVSVAGNTTLGDASTDTVQVNGYMGVGGAAGSNIGIFERHSALTGVNQYGVGAYPISTSAATTKIVGFGSGQTTTAAAFTVTDSIGFEAANILKGAGSTITNQHGLYIQDQTQGTNNYGITSLVSSGTNKWNIYASGTAANYFAGNVGIGTNSPTSKLDVYGGVATDVRNAILSNGASDVAFQIAAWQGDAGSSDGTVIGRLGLSYATTKNSFINFHRGGSTTGGFMSFSTNNGTERLRIDSAGNVGIGTIAPTRPLEVAGTPVIFGSAQSVIRAADTRAFAQGVGGGIAFTGNATTGQTDALTNFATIHAAKTNSVSSDTSGDLIFSTRKTGSDLAERMRINSDGNVGIGTDTLRAIEVAGGGAAGAVNILSLETATAGSYSGLTAVRNDNTTSQLGATINLARTRGSAVGSTTLVLNGDTLGGIAWSGADGTDIRTKAAEIVAQVDGTPGVNDMPGRLVFSTTADGAATPTERLRIDSSGNVGIGTSSPTAARLCVTTTSSAEGFNPAAYFGISVASQGGFIGSRTATGNQRQGLYVSSQQMLTLWGDAAGDGSGVLDVVSGASPSATADTNSLFRINADGNVGIGTSSPATRLHVQMPTTTAQGSAREILLRADSDGTNNSFNSLVGVTFSNRWTGQTYSAGSFDRTSGVYGINTDNSAFGRSMGLVFYTSPLDQVATERMRINSDGNVGIGISPSVRLHAYTTGAGLSTVGRFEQVNAGDSYTLNINIDPDNNVAELRAGGTQMGALTFATNNTERLRIDSAGNLGLGVTPSGWIGTSVLEMNYLSVTSQATNVATLTTNAFFDGAWKYKVNGVALQYRQQADGAFVWRTAPSGTAGNAITFTQVLAVEKDKSLALQGATSVTGAGISFPATQVASSDANTLDEYREGTFTPTIVGTTTAGAGTYSAQVGRYTRIGNRVMFQILVSYSAHTGTGNMYVGGLPFTSNTTANVKPPVSILAENLTYTNDLVAVVLNNTTSVTLYTQSSAAALTSLAMDTAATLYIAGHYEV